MIILNTPQTLSVQLAGSSSAPLPIVISYVDAGEVLFSPAAVVAASNGVTLTQILGSPVAAYHRQVKFISVYNPNVASATVSLFLDTSKIITVVLPQDATLHYTDTDGFKVMFTDGINGSAGAAGTNGANSYVYIAYASDASGTGFTTTFNAALDYIAVKTTTTVIASPAVGDFTGLWKNYKGAPGSVAGSDTQVQFNDGGAFGADAGLVYNKTTDALTAGSLVLTNGQIVFPATQNASANANTLDDYEEGTWTPAIGGTATYTSQVGTYTKIGRLVNVRFVLIVNVLGTGSTSTVSGLPFASSDNYPGCVGSFSGLASSVAMLACYTSASTVVLTSVAAAGANAMTNPAAVLGNGSQVYVSITYFV